MEPQASESRPGFWPTCVAVFVAGWVGGLAVGFVWGLLGSYGATLELMRGFGAAPRQGDLLEVIAVTVVGQSLLRAAVGGLVLPRLLRWATGAEISRLDSVIALAAGGLASHGGWYALVRTGATTRPVLSFLMMLVGFLVSVWIVRTAVSEPSRTGAALVLVAPAVAILVVGWLVLFGDRGDGRLDRFDYQAASLAAQESFAALYQQVESSGRSGTGLEVTMPGVQENLREAAADLERAGPPEVELDDAHHNFASGLRTFADGLEALEDVPAGSDPAVMLPSVAGLEQIRTALLELREAGYRVDDQAWRLTL